MQKMWSPDVWLAGFEPMVGDLAAVWKLLQSQTQRIQRWGIGHKLCNNSSGGKRTAAHLFFCSFSISTRSWEDSVMDFQGYWTPYYLRNSAEWQEYWCERWPSPQALEASKTWSVSHYFSFFKYFLHRFLEHLCCFRQGLSFHEFLIFARSVRLAEQDCLLTLHYTCWTRRLKYYQVLLSSGDKSRYSLLNTESCGICPLAKGGTGHERAPSSILSSRMVLFHDRI